MLIRVTYQDKMLRWQQVIEVRGLVMLCAGNHEASYVDQPNHC